MKIPGAAASARNAALAATALSCIGGTLSTIVWPSSRPQAQSHAVIDGVLFLAMALTPRAAWRIAANVIFLASVASVLAAGWMLDEKLAHAGVSSAPFLACKLSSVTIAVIAPFDLWVGALGAAATGIIPMLQYFHWPATVRAGVPQPDPWAALFYSMMGMALLLYRKHQLAIQHQLASAQARAASYEKFMRRFLAVRDASNTPLQTIEYTTRLLQAEHPEAEEQWKRVQRAVGRLRKLSDILSRYAPRAHSVDDTSLDPFEILEQLHNEKDDSGDLN
jgi:hypothetical protein